MVTAHPLQCPAQEGEVPCTRRVSSAPDSLSGRQNRRMLVGAERFAVDLKINGMGCNNSTYSQRFILVSYFSVCSQHGTCPVCVNGRRQHSR
jgi:hypothetical protein